MLATRSVLCPYCGERFETALDCSAGDQEYIEDCQVCCRPIVFAIATDFDGGLLSLEVRREDD
jgi:Cysteine-rich CPXCG